MASSKSKVAIIGSGNWGSVAAKLVASNTLKLSSFHDEVRMWVFEETLPSGEKLSSVINQTHENVKYLPGIKLGENVVADPDVESAVRDANMLVFVTPHQFIDGICKKLVGKIRQDAVGISLIKGMDLKPEGPNMVSKLIKDSLQIDCCVLMGANIANEIAMEQFSEATVGYAANKLTADEWVRLFNSNYFLVSAVQDVEGVELCGTLKNVVAIAAGLVDGLELGNNTKAAIMRIGLNEMRAFCKMLFSSVNDATFFESCGVADLWGGETENVPRHLPRVVAIGFPCGPAINFWPYFVLNGIDFYNSPSLTFVNRSFDELEAEMLNGQKLQGVLTAKEVYVVLSQRGCLQMFPLFTTVYHICTGRLPPSDIVRYREHANNSAL